MFDAGRQLCDHCEYDITGIASAGRLIRCPECGGDNRIGATNAELIRQPVPPWWYLVLALGWPSLLWLPFGLSAFNTRAPAMVKTAAIFAIVAVVVAAARGFSMAVDCSVPGRRGPVLAWVLMWAMVGAIGLPVATLAAVWGGWMVVGWLNRLNGTPI